MKSPSFSADNLLTTLSAISVSRQYYLAYSGGLDSHVLLHALQSIQTKLSANICALHVNHGFNRQADKWAEHCEITCKTLGIDFSLLEIEASCPHGESREAWARQRRYRLLATRVADEGLLLTAHHQDDQAETLLLQLARGGGVKGLAAMPELGKRDGMWLARPLLGVNRQQLLEYAKLHDLQWIEDDSNMDLAFDRNFFRHDILPKLQQRWPTISETLARVASHQADAMMLLKELADVDLNDCKGDSEDRLNVEQVLKLSLVRQANLIRHWLRRQTLPVPDTRLMQEILNKLLPAKVDAEPLVRWQGTEIRRYQQQLYASEPGSIHDSLLQVDWQMTSSCQLNDGVLSANLGKGVGIKVDICPDQQLQVRYRQGGEKIQLLNKKHRQELKKLFQQAGVPPWIRDRIPLLYRDEKLIAVADLWIAATACSSKDEIAWQLSWTGLEGHKLNIKRQYDD